MKQMLIDKKLKVTPARIMILKVLKSLSKPAQPSDIHTRVSKKIKIDLATTYRNLQKLEEANIIKSVYLHDNQTRFEMNDHHHHLVCTKCNSIEEYKDCKLDTAIENLKINFGFSANSHSLEFFGVCKTCQ